MMQLHLDQQPALIDQVHDRLLAAIIDGTLPPGFRLTQESAADMLGVSRQPVSHALQVLKRRGLLIEHGRKGLAVSAVEADRVRQLYQVRSALDVLAAQLSAGRVRAGTLTAHERLEILAIVDAGQALGPDAAITALIDADVAFHSGIYRLSGNSAISETVAEQWPHFRRSMGLVLRGGTRRRQVWVEHQQIVQAILNGDAVAATALAQSHAEKAGDDTARRLQAGEVDQAPNTTRPTVKEKLSTSRARLPDET
jgi:DNA-binding GntR family transcriptional regulator